VPVAAPDTIASVVVLQIDGEPVVPPLPSVGAQATATAAQPGNEAANAVDGTAAKRWRAPADVKSASLEVDLGRAVTINGFGFDEPDVWPRLNQKFTVEAQAGGAWTKVADGRTNGHGLKRPIDPVTARKFRITLECAQGAPGLAEVQLYRPE
jgi:hypothetical protein